MKTVHPMPSDLGTFAPVFETPHRYLALLNLSAADSTEAVRLVRQCAIADTDRASILSLLADIFGSPDPRANGHPTVVPGLEAFPGRG
jgi:hypothetical protein